MSTTDESPISTTTPLPAPEDLHESGESTGFPDGRVRFVDREGVTTLVRPFRSSDREALLGMYEAFDPRHTAQGLPPQSPTRRERWLEFLLEEGVNVVAEHDGRIVGHALYTPASEPEPELAVFVHQDVHGRGIGTKLCRYVLATAAANDRDALCLDVERRNHVARHVYRSLGFEPVESGAGELHMRLELSSAGQGDGTRAPASSD